MGFAGSYGLWNGVCLVFAQWVYITWPATGRWVLNHESCLLLQSVIWTWLVINISTLHRWNWTKPGRNHVGWTFVIAACLLTNSAAPARCLEIQVSGNTRHFGVKQFCIWTDPIWACVNKALEDGLCKDYLFNGVKVCSDSLASSRTPFRILREMEHKMRKPPRKSYSKFAISQALIWLDSAEVK